MPFDITGIGIVVALIGTAIFAAIEMFRHKDIEVMNSVVVFLALYAMVAGTKLISAALYGDPESLPSSWREYLCVAGVVGIGLSLQHLIKSTKKIFAKTGNAERTEKSS